MAKYLLDTNICISLIKNRYGLRSKIERIGEQYCAVSEITIAELFYFRRDKSCIGEKRTTIG